MLDETAKEQQIAIQQWLQMDVTPLREMRQILTQNLHRSLEDVQGIYCAGETVIVDGTENNEWPQYKPTGRRWFTLAFPNEEKITFIQDQEGVRVGELPESATIEVG